MNTAELQQNSAELVLLALLEEQSRHGYDLAKMVVQESGSLLLSYQVASIYPMLHRLEKKGFIKGRWVEKPDERRRKFYALTEAGQQALASQRVAWREFFAALNRIARFAHV